MPGIINRAFQKKMEVLNFDCITEESKVAWKLAIEYCIKLFEGERQALLQFSKK